MSYKRPAGDKSGMAAVYQQNAASSAAAAAAYQAQALMQLQQPYVPVSCEYSGAAAISSTSCSSGLVTTSTFSSSASNASSSTSTTSSTSTVATTSAAVAASTAASLIASGGGGSSGSGGSGSGMVSGGVGGGGAGGAGVGGAINPNPNNATLALTVTNGSGASYDAATLVALSSLKRADDSQVADGLNGLNAIAAELSEEISSLGGSSHGIINSTNCSNVGGGLKRPRSPSTNQTVALAPPAHVPQQTPTSSLTTALSSAPGSNLAQLYTSTSSALHYPALQSQSALAYTGVSLNKQHSVNNHAATAAAGVTPAAAAAAAAATGFSSSMAAMQQQYQQYLQNPYASLVGAQAVQQAAAAQSAAFVNPYSNPFANNSLLNGLSIPSLSGVPGVATASAAGQSSQATAQQLAALQGLHSINSNLAAAAAHSGLGFLPAPGSLGMYAAAAAAAQQGANANHHHHPLSSHMSHFNQSVLPQYMSLGLPGAANAAAGMHPSLRGVVPGAVGNMPNVGVSPSAAAAAAAAAAMANAGLQPYKKMRTI